MASENVELLRSIYTAWERGDFGAADWAVLVLLHRSGRGKTSGLDLGQVGTQGAHVFHVRDSKVTRVVTYVDRKRALAELGLSEQDVREKESPQ